MITPQDLSQGPSETGQKLAPASQSAPEGEGAYSTLSKAAERRVILCVEDELECSSLIKEEFEERGFHVIVADNGHDALLLLESHRVDIVLSDINMPVMSGFQLLERLKEMSPHLLETPFIFLTGSNDKVNEMAGRMLGADDYIRKPIDFDILHAIITARLAGIARRCFASSGQSLTAREVEVLTWVAHGKTRDEIGRIVGITKRTVDFHLDNARRALGVETIMEAAVKAAVLGFINS